MYRSSFLPTHIVANGAISYYHGYDEEVFQLGLAFDEEYVGGFAGRCLQRTGKDEGEVFV